MVDLKLLIYPEILHKASILRKRCKTQSIACKAAQNGNCSCGERVDFNEAEAQIPRIKRRYILGSIVLLVLIALILAAFYGGLFGRGLAPDDEALLNPRNPTEPLPPSTSVLRVFKKAAVCADSAACAQVGK
ncbi:hypothetical protein D910_10697 [Dendroctonus ponderosae]